MKSLSPEASRSDRQADGASRQRRRLGLLVLMAAAAAAAVLGFGVLHGPPKPAGRGTGPGKTRVSRAWRRVHPEVIARFERTLAGFDRLIVLANLVFEDAAAVQQARKQVVDLMIQARNPRLRTWTRSSREIAEIAVIEYRSGTSVQDTQVAEGELSLAKSGLERGRRTTAEAKERLAMISARSDNSALGLNLKYIYTDRLASAELMEKQSCLELEQAESKKKVLLEYTIPKRRMELASEVKKAHSDELAKQATWELRKGQEEAARRGPSRKTCPRTGSEILALIDEAIPLEDKIRAKLLEVSQVEELPESKAEEFGRLTHDLAALVDRAELLRDSGDFARLKPRIQEAARQFGAAASK